MLLTAAGSALEVHMKISVATGAESDQVWFGIISKVAAWIDVVNLKLGRASAALTAPAVALQHLITKLAYGLF